MKYKLLISYDGTPFGGWQVQQNTPSIQEHIQKALQTILRTPSIGIIGAGRTDAGVHACGQVAHFKHDKPIDLKRTFLSLNALLPPEIRILEITPIDETFHARFSAIGKIYHYHLHLKKVKNPFNRLYTTYHPYPLDLEQMKRSLSLFVGTHDFSSFANEPGPGNAPKTNVRTLSRLDMIPTDDGIRLEFEGNGFLYKMVRNITGTLLDVGEGKLSPEEIKMIFESKDRTRSGRCAPPQGLFLMHVHYPSQLEGIASNDSKCVTPSSSGQK